MGFKPTTDSLWVRCVISQFCFSSTINIIATTSNQDSHEDVHFQPTCPYFQLHCSMGGGGERTFTTFYLFYFTTSTELETSHCNKLKHFLVCFWECKHISGDLKSRFENIPIYIYIYIMTLEEEGVILCCFFPRNC